MNETNGFIKYFFSEIEKRLKKKLSSLFFNFLFLFNNAEQNFIKKDLMFTFTTNTQEQSLLLRKKVCFARNIKNCHVNLCYTIFKKRDRS
jgi:hypothetical protein